MKSLVITPTGDLQFIYDDELAPFLELGNSDTTRASFVEPAPGGGWSADMSPCGGGVLGPYKRRGTALARERAWLNARPETWPGPRAT